MKSLFSEYLGEKDKIKARLKEFELVWQKTDKKIFSELCFCICTPQSKAVVCGEAIRELEKTGMLFNANVEELKLCLKGVRFQNNKAKYILRARELFTTGGKINIKNKIILADIRGTRTWFQERVLGLGLKETSHFLRNIGFGEDLAILDVHVLRNMVKYGVIKEVPGYMSKKTYLQLEEKLAKFSREIKIPMAELDLLFWSRETGRIYK